MTNQERQEADYLIVTTISASNTANLFLLEK